MKYYLATGMLFLMLISVAIAAPTVTINSPNGGELITQNDGNFTIDFNISNPPENHSLNIYYDSDAVLGGATEIVVDLNIYDGMCDDANFEDSTRCAYSWDSTGVNGNYYILVLFETDLTKDYSDGVVMVDNNAPTINSIYPEDNGWINNPAPQIQFTSMELESDINTLSLSWEIDGNIYDISDSHVDYNSSIQTFYFTPDYNFTEYATINIVASVDDNAGNNVSESWSFQTDYTSPGSSIADSEISNSWVRTNDFAVRCDNNSAGAPCDLNIQYYFIDDPAAGSCSLTKSNYVNWTTNGNITVSTDENRYVCIWAEDLAGNSDTDHSTKPLRVDSTVPLTTISYVGGWQNTSDINLQCTDFGIYDLNISGCQNTNYNISNEGYVSLTNSDGNQPFIQTVSMPDANNIFKYYSNDRAGNSESIITTYIAIDTTPPTNPDINIDTFVSEDAPDMDLYAYDATSGVSWMAFSCNDINYTSWLPFSSTHTDFNILDSSFGCNTSQGDKNVFVKFMDDANNESASAYTTTNYDTNAPIASISPGAPIGWVTTDYNITLSCSDLESGPANLLYWIGSTAYSKTGSDYNVVFNMDGNHEFIYTCEDNAGNSDTNTTIYVPIDKTAPSTSMSPSGWQTADFNVTLSCVDSNISGCAATTYRLDTNSGEGVSYGAWLPYTIPILVSSDGNYAIDFNSVDVAGNTETVQTAYILRDTTNPTIGSVSTSVSNDDVTISYSGDDNVSGILGYWVMRSGGNWIYTTNTSYTFNNLSNGDYNFYVISTNNADLNSPQSDANATVNYNPTTPLSPTVGSGGGGGGGSIIVSEEDQNTDAATTNIDSSTTDGGEEETSSITEGGTTDSYDTLTIIDNNVSDTNSSEEPLGPTGLFGLGEVSPLAILAVMALLVLGFVAATNKRIRALFTGEE